MLEDVGMVLSLVAYCTDNGPMEGFGVTREMYYGRKYHTKEELVQAITEYMEYLYE